MHLRIALVDEHGHGKQVDGPEVDLDDAGDIASQVRNGLIALLRSATELGDLTSVDVTITPYSTAQLEAELAEAIKEASADA